MVSQWQCLLKNTGTWQGSFTRLSPTTGEIVEDLSTEVSFTPSADGEQMRQVVRKFHPGQEPEDLVLNYGSLNKGTLFFENGAFSQGSIQWGPFSSQFGAELGLIAGDRRLRLVQLYGSDNACQQLTLIREQLQGSNAPERPPLTLEALEGVWQGQAVTLYPDLGATDTFTTTLTVQREGDILSHSLDFGGHRIQSTGRIEGPAILFEKGSQPMRLLLLPDGASSNCPTHIHPRKPFLLEVGWLLEPGLRQRMIRQYSEQGSWVSLTLVTERKGENL